MSFAQNLEYLMNDRGYSMYRVSQLTGFSQTTIKNWLIGKTTPYEKEWDEIAKKLKTTTADLFGTDGLEEQKEKPTVQNDELQSQFANAVMSLCPEDQEKLSRLLDSLAKEPEKTKAKFALFLEAL